MKDDVCSHFKFSVDLKKRTWITSSEEKHIYIQPCALRSNTVCPPFSRAHSRLVYISAATKTHFCVAAQNVFFCKYFIFTEKMHNLQTLHRVRSKCHKRKAVVLMRLLDPV